MVISNDLTDIIITYSLGSCLGVALYDPVARVAGLVHCMLPLSQIDMAKAKAMPGMFTDTGVVMLLDRMLEMGALTGRIIAKVAGAASPLDDKGLFKIGQRNYTVMRKILWKNNILIASEDCGGTKARTMLLYVADGKTVVKSCGVEREL
jgi:chemotaxis protein CheD